MGFLEKIKKSVSQLGKDNVGVTNASNVLTSSQFAFPIVGEFYKAQSFEAIKAQLNSSNGDSVQIEALVKNDPKNPYAKNGKAVAVYILDNQVGFISEEKSSHIFDLLKTRGGKGTCQATVFFSPKPAESANSVELQIKWPPAFEEQESISEETSSSIMLNASGIQFEAELLPFINGTEKEFHQLGQGYSLVSKLLKIGAEPGDKLIFDNDIYLSSLVTTKHNSLNQGEVGLILMGELVAKITDKEDSRLHDLVDKRGGYAAAKAQIVIGVNGVTYIANVQNPKVSSAQSNKIHRPQLIKGTFSGIAEVDPGVTSRSEDNLDYQVDRLGLGVGSTAFLIGAVCHFDGQKSDNVFVQCDDTIGGILGHAKEVLRPILSKHGYYDGSKTSLGVWMMITRKSAKKTKVEVVLDNPIVLQ